MTDLKKFEVGLSITNRIISDIIFMFQSRAKETYFTRTGKNNKMDFKSILLFIMNFVRKSVQIELDDFFKKIKSEDFTVTKQAFSEARQKILPEAFITLTDAILKWFYTENDFKTYEGYRLSAIDGSILELNNTKKLREEFGFVENKALKVARALSAGLYDIENDMMLATKISRYDTSERDLAVELIEKLEEIGFKNDLILFDRGYPSMKLISFIESKKIKYLMRVSRQFINEVNNARKEDQIIEVKYKRQKIKIRVLRFMLDSGEEEILITNIYNENMSIKNFKDLYFKRWGIEVKFNEVKNKLQIENFTGETVIAVEQDFYAAIYLTNMVSLAKQDANDMIEQNNEGKNLKHEYKVNTSLLIGKLKDSMVLMLLEESKRKRSKILKKIMQEISRNVIPIRPGRSFIRRMGVRTNKFSSNYKSSL